MTSMASFLPSGIVRGTATLRKRSFDIVNTHFVLPTGPVGAWLASKANIPNVLTVHGGDLYDPSKASSPHRHLLLRIIVRKLLRRATVVVGQSKNTIENVHKFYAPDLNCERIPLGIIRPGDITASRQELGFEPNDKILVTVGRLVSRKAVDRLIEMVADIPDPSVHLVIIGDGPLRGQLESIALQKGIAERVRFVGFVTDQQKQNLLSASDIYVSTSQHEGFGLVFLEAMAAGLPIVCFDHGGQSDFLENGRTGALVPLNDEVGFTHACQSYLQSAEKRLSAQSENLNRVESYFIDRCASRYEELFEQTIDEYSHRK
jgi:glycosyltransferase involved in cell wall biosynthesis